MPSSPSTERPPQGGPRPADARALPVTTLHGVGPKLAERLARLGIARVLDLLLHLPLRYQDRSRVTPIGAARPGAEVVIEGAVEHTAVVRRRRPMLVSRVADGSGSVSLRFFNFSAGQREALRRGRRVRCFGELRAAPGGAELVHPETLFDPPESPAAGVALTPVYPTTEGLHQLALRRLVETALEGLREGRVQLPELLPRAVRERQRLEEIAPAVIELHNPPAGEDGGERAVQRARRRLAFEELLAHNLSLGALRERARESGSPPLAGTGDLRERFLGGLGFDLTGAQARVAAEIDADLAGETPMLRLVQGDVGSGKTVVAALAVLRALESGYQAAVMAPTELLAEQHLANFVRWFDPLGIEVARVSGKLPAAARRHVAEALHEGRAGVAVGTHALFQASVEFHRLGLIVIDEQHRFGVHQRLALREKGAAGGWQPHQLIMTATPIPRTLAMTAYADLDCSVIDELPPGRTPVQTAVLAESRRDEVVRRIRAACAAGRQAYWVCPLVEESEALQIQAAEQTEAMLAETLAGLRVGLVHGRMKSVAKDRVMAEFQRGRIDVLVATTVIEVGVDVPNASLMIIENAERLGLAQLHQLRGRVGRGTAESSCLLLYKPPLGAAARTRLQTLRESNDGFLIAEKDLEMRGPGEVLGVRQAGQMAFRVADLQRDAGLIGPVREAADLLRNHHPEAVEALIERWVAGRADYANA